MKGTISQAVRAFELRKTRYLGLPKMHLQAIALATAVNLSRFWDDSFLTPEQPATLPTKPLTFPTKIHPFDSSFLATRAPLSL
ncbi:MAG: transposase [Chloroflexi bacterium]|nr:transposase [Chloroflexota bacterium]